MSLTHFSPVLPFYISEFLILRVIQSLFNATMDGWVLNFCEEVLRKNNGEWYFIPCNSYVTLSFFILYIFWWCIGFFPLVMIYMTAVGSVNYSFVKRCFTTSVIYLAATRVGPHEFVGANLYQSLLRTNLAEINLCGGYIRYGITVPGHFVMYMGKGIRLLRGAYPAGKLRWHFTCGFYFRHSLWLPFEAAFVVLRGLIMVPVGAMDLSWPGDGPFRAVGGGLVGCMRVRGLARAGALPWGVYPVGKLPWHFTCGFDFCVQSWELGLSYW